MTATELELAKIGAWPAAVTVIAVAFFLIFWKPIAGLVGRLRTFDLFGAKGEARPEIEQSPDAAKAATSEIGEAARKEPTLALPPKGATPTTPSTPPLPGGNAKSPLLTFVEGNIRSDAKLTALASDSDRVELLIQHQAVTQVEVVFERLYRILFGSQVRALRAAIRPAPLSVLQNIFEDAKTRFPGAHGNRSFDQWAGFLVETNLGVRLPDQNGIAMCSISVLGHEFLIYMDRMGYPEPWG